MQITKYVDVSSKPLGFEVRSNASRLINKGSAFCLSRLYRDVSDEELQRILINYPYLKQMNRHIKRRLNED